MAKSKKTKEELVDNTPLETIGELKLREPKKLENCEWCFQFDEDEPQIFAWTNEDMKDEDPTVTFTIGNKAEAYIYLLQVKCPEKHSNYLIENYLMKEIN